MNSFEKFITPEMMSLTDKYAIKILLCFFLKQIDRPVTPNQLMEIATSDNIINYFQCTEAINELIKADSLKLDIIDGEECYVLTELGSQGANAFKNLVPKSFRDKILTAGLKLFAKLKIEHDVKCSIRKLEKGYSVDCVCNDMDVTLLDMKLFAPDADQAELIKNKIMKNPTEFYSKILDFALENEDYVPDISDL